MENDFNTKKCLDNIYPELQFKILTYLSIDDLTILSEVSREWRYLSEDSELWKSVDNIQLPAPPNPDKFQDLETRCPKKYLYLRHKRIMNKWLNPKETSKVNELTFNGEKDITCLATTQDGRLVSGHGSKSHDYVIRVWNVSKREIDVVLKGHRKPVQNVFNIVGESKILALDCTEIRIWDISSGEVTHKIERITHGGGQAQLRENVLVETSFDKVTNTRWVFVWDIKQAVFIKKFNTQSNILVDIRFDGKSIWVCETKDERTKVQQWAVGSQEIHDQPVHTFFLDGPNSYDTFQVLNMDKSSEENRGITMLSRKDLAEERSSSLWISNFGGSELTNAYESPSPKCLLPHVKFCRAEWIGDDSVLICNFYDHTNHTFKIVSNICAETPQVLGTKGLTDTCSIEDICSIPMEIDGNCNDRRRHLISMCHMPSSGWKDFTQIWQLRTDKGANKKAHIEHVTDIPTLDGEFAKFDLLQMTTTFMAAIVRESRSIMRESLADDQNRSHEKLVVFDCNCD